MKKEKKQAVQSFKLSEQEQKLLRYVALSERMSVSEFIRKSVIINLPTNEKR